MKEDILFLVHVEEAFRKFFPDPLYVQRLRRAVQAKKYRRVYVMESNIDRDYVMIHELQDLCGITKIDWGWGYEKDMFDGDENKWVIETSSPHEWTWVAPEIRRLNFANIKCWVGGGCMNECLQDFIDVLEFLNADYTKVQGYIY